MARKERNNVDYFPFICEEGNKMFYIEEKYGNDGFATFVKILRELAKKDFHFIDLSNKSSLMFLSAKCKVSEQLLISIIESLVELGKFDKTVWEEKKVIWCQDFIDSIQDAYDRRNNKCMNYLSLCNHLSIKSNHNIEKCNLNEVINTQRIGEDRIEENIYRKIKSLVLTFDEFEKLEKLGYSKNSIDDMLDRIENYKGNKKYNSLYLTVLNWLKKDSSNNKPKQDEIPQHIKEHLESLTRR